MASDFITTLMSYLERFEEKSYNDRNLYLDNLSFTGEATEKGCDSCKDTLDIKFL